MVLEKQQTNTANHFNAGINFIENDLAKTESTVGAAGLAITNTAADGGGTARPSPPRTRGGPRPTCARNHTTRSLTDNNASKKQLMHLIRSTNSDVERSVQRQTAHSDGYGRRHRRVRPYCRRANGEVDALKVRRIVNIDSVANLKKKSHATRIHYGSMWDNSLLAR